MVIHSNTTQTIQKASKYWGQNFKKYTMGVYNEICVSPTILQNKVSHNHKLIHTKSVLRSGHTSVSLNLPNFGKICPKWSQHFRLETARYVSASTVKGASNWPIKSKRDSIKFQVERISPCFDCSELWFLCGKDISLRIWTDVVTILNSNSTYFKVVKSMVGRVSAAGA